MTGRITLHHRKSIRLEEYDYSSPGMYFVTICTQDRDCFFGDIEEGFIELSPIGKIVKQYWIEIHNHFENTQLDQFVVIPNHIHGILIIEDVGVQYIEPLQRHKYQKMIPKSIGSIIRSYKASVTRWCRNNEYEHFRWQRNYYEHIIRNEDELNEIREYITNNPLKWELDEENPENWR